MAKTVARKVSCRTRQILYFLFTWLVWFNDRPRAMWQKSRPARPDFADDERLFIRWFSNWMEEGGRPRPAHLATPDQSSIRSGFGGKFWHVLMPEPESKGLPNLCKGVLEICVRDLPQPGEGMTVAVVHDPMPHNYGHCEIRAFGGGVRLNKKSMTAKQKVYYQTELAKKIQLALIPELLTRDAQRQLDEARRR
jgi:hypothetical protein